MTHVGIERFGSGDGEHDGAQDCQRLPAAGRQELHAVERVEGADDIGLADDAGDAERGQHREPDAHDRAEQAADAVGAVRLDHEQRDQDDDGAGHDEGLQLGRHHLQALDGAEHRDRRRDQAVAVEEGDADDGEADHQCLRPLALGQAEGEGGEREDAAFATVVGARDQQDVFDRDDDDEGPEHEREHAEHGVVDARQTGGGGDRFAQRVDRAGAYVAIDDAQRADDQRPLVPRRRPGALVDTPHGRCP